VLRIFVIVMKFPVTLLSLLILITITAASSLEPSSILESNTTFQEKHGCPSQGCPHNSASTLNSGCLEMVYGAIIISLAALA
jgi:ABC-type phosphate transport system permease subunit